MEGNHFGGGTVLTASSFSGPTLCGVREGKDELADVVAVLPGMLKRSRYHVRLTWPLAEASPMSDCWQREAPVFG